MTGERTELGPAYALVPVVAGAVTAGLAAVDPWTVALGPVRYVGLGPVVAGVSLALWTGRTFRAQGASLSPVASTDRLVTDGPLAYTRNPLYGSVVLAGGGIAWVGGSPVATGYTLALWFVYHVIVVRVEEPRLRAAFGDEYGAYCREVPRWFAPRSLPT